ncbi:hypothetical protein [Streptomyces sp. STR69]|uniref:hypothetical protein n=1 Tax=Streptomyces sp. STR69 TaxID=1796942 RepID=UPI0021C7B722|nr:hypothetical protein [Streptomyces sp. STR69]
MTNHDTYGTSTHTTGQLARLVVNHLDVTFTARESDYRGVYHVADSICGRIEIQPNAIPGDDAQDDLYVPEHPSIHVLLLITTPSPDSTVHDRLDCIDGLAHPGREVW